MIRRPTPQSYYDNNNRINEARKKNGLDPLPPPKPYVKGEWDEGYCMSIGCSCDTETAPSCRLFRKFDQDGIKKDFIWQALGW